MFLLFETLKNGKLQLPVDKKKSIYLLFENSYAVIGPDHVKLEKKNWAGPNFIPQFTLGLQFTFSYNSLVLHDPAQSQYRVDFDD